MKWITTDQAATAAKQGTIPALECSLEHHQQGRDADWRELRDAITRHNFHLQGELCAVCTGDCTTCPLAIGKVAQMYCCNKLWNKANMAFEVLRAYFSNANFRAFQEAEAGICRYIEEVLDKERAKEKKPCKCKAELRHGDYGTECDGAQWAVLYRNVQLEVFGNNSGSGITTTNTWPTSTRKLGNIFDDLKRNSEDLEEFSMNVRFGERIQVCAWNKKITIHFINKDNPSIHDDREFNIDEATEIHQKLGQLLATAKRKQK